MASPKKYHPIIVENAKKNNATATKITPKCPNTAWNACCVNEIPVPSAFPSAIKITNADNVKITKVSIKTVTIATCPWSSGFLTFAIAWACGVEPIPASFENNPLATPNLIAFFIPIPKNPPKTAFVEKAFTKIALNAKPAFPIFNTIMNRHITT